MPKAEDIEVSKTEDEGNSFVFGYNNGLEENIEVTAFIDVKGGNEASFESIKEKDISLQGGGKETQSYTVDLSGKAKPVKLRHTIFVFEDGSSKITNEWEFTGTTNGKGGDTGGDTGGGDTGGDTGGGDTGGDTGGGTCQIIKERDGRDARGYVFGEQGRENPRNGAIGTGLRTIYIGGEYGIRYLWRTLIIKPTCILFGKDAAKEINKAVEPITKSVTNVTRGAFGGLADILDKSPLILLVIAVIAGIILFNSDGGNVSFQRLREQAGDITQ